MPQVINSNISSLTAQRNLDTSQNALATSLQRLSSGLRINSAKDDAAGLAISERMTAQIGGLNQAARNANDGISLAQTAEGALAEITNNLQRMRQLAVQSANASNSATDRSSLQAEATQRIAEITRVASQTQFNGLNLLDGSFTTQTFQVGANANQTISVSSIADARSSALGSHVLVTNGTAMSTMVRGDIATLVNNVAVEADLTITTGAGTSSAISYAAGTAGSLTTTGGAREIAAAINSAASTLGVTATATNSTTLASLSAAGTIQFNLNGQAVTAAIADQNDLSNLVSAINGVQGTTGVTATFTSTSSKSNITLSTTDGRNIVLDSFQNSSLAGNQTIQFGGSGAGQLLTEGAAATASGVVTGSVSLSSSQGALSVANSNASVFTATSSSFQSVAALSLTIAANAQTAIGTLDAALGQINVSRGDLGAYQNRFSSAISNLQSSAENISAARSRIQDSDFAAETASLTRNQILQQAGTAMLAQANALPQNVLTLLRG